MFIQFSIIFLITLLLTLVFKKINQPLIIGYIIAGILLGNLFVNSADFKNLINFMAELGVALMLFIVGLELKLKNLKEIGKLSLIIGILQEVLTIISGVILAYLLGFNLIESIYLGLALSFSSTILMVKLISDKGDLEKFYGKLAVGFLIVQDLITILILLTLPFFSLSEITTSPHKFLIGLCLIFIIPVFSYRFLPKSEKFLAETPELLFTFAITFALIISSIFKQLSLGIEIGSLVAGVSLSSLKISTEIASKLKPVRDFFLILFFVYLGSNVFVSYLDDILIKAIILSLFVLIFNPIIMWLIISPLKISKKSAFLLSLTSGQISEFSFILINLGVALSHINKEFISLISLIGIITFLGSTYIFSKGEEIYEKSKRFIPYKEKPEIFEIVQKPFEIILFGCDRIGYSFLKIFSNTKEKLLIVDYNLEKINEIENLGFNALYGDASEIEFLNALNLQNAKLVISTIPDFQTNFLILEEFKKKNENGVFICTSYKVEDALRLYESGADYVITPHFLGGEHASHIVEDFMFNKKEYEKIKEAEINKLKERAKLGHQHPIS